MNHYPINRNIKSNSRRRRILQLRIRAIAFMVCIVAVFILAFMSKSTVSDADNHSQKEVKLFTSIEVNYGDTLSSIALEYIDEHYENTNDYINEVVRINSLDNSDELIAGQYIIVPYYTSME